jgi:Zn-dependent protease
MFDENFFRMALVGGPVILLSLTVHEYFHAWTALKFGDPTARDMNRLNLNPLNHLTLMGTAVMVFSGFRFGWARPVPVNLANVRDPRKADLWISFAGPLSNIGMATIAALLIRFSIYTSIDLGNYLYNFLSWGVTINLALAAFNMIPLFPLDGSHILKALLPPRYEASLAQFEQISPMILLFLIIAPSFLNFSLIWAIIGPFVKIGSGVLLYGL